MANHTYENINLSKICLETPFTEDRIFTATGAGTTKAGTILQLAGDKYVVGLAAGTFDAVLQYDVVATGAGDLPIRPVLSGKVRADKVFLELTPTTALTASQKAKLRANDILAVSVDELGKFNNPGA